MLIFSKESQLDQLWEQHWEDLTNDLQRRVQRDINDYGLEITVEQRTNHEIVLILNKNDRSLKDFPLMPLPLPDMVRRLGNRFIREQLDYDREKEKENLDILLLTLNSD